MSVTAKNNPLLQYHPVRFYKVRKDFIAEATNILLSGYKSGINQVSLIANDIRKRAWLAYITPFIRQISSSVSNEAYPTYVRKIDKMGKIASSLKDGSEMDYAAEFFDLITNDEYITFEQYVSFSIHGSNIFEFSTDLLDFFAKTDVDNVLLKDIRLPFSTIYLYFGRQEDKKINGNISSIIESLKQNNISNLQEDTHFLLDGAYISQCPNTGTLTINLTSVKNKSSKYINNCTDCYEETLSFTLRANSVNTNVREAAAIHRQISLDLNRNIVKQKKNEGTATKMYFDAAYLNERVDTIIDYLKLIINCVLYLQSYPDDIEEDYPDSTPKNLVEQTKRAPGAAAAAQKKLNQLGYRKIKFCGRKRQQFWQLEDEEDSEPVLVGADRGEPKRNMSPHKRRAHLRKQRYGKELQSWRYVWIKETTIHKDKYQQMPSSYRIYEVAD